MQYIDRMTAYWLETAELEVKLRPKTQPEGVTLACECFRRADQGARNLGMQCAVLRGQRRIARVLVQSKASILRLKERAVRVLRALR